MKRTMSQYKVALLNGHKNKCWCGYQGLLNLPIIGYQHPDGYEVDGLVHKQWLYVSCPQCQYDWALWKLGVIHPLNDK